MKPKLRTRPLNLIPVVAAFLFVCAFTISVVAGDITESTKAVLKSSPFAVRRTWTQYDKDYTKAGSANDSAATWAELQSYAKAFWEIEKVISPGQSISDYPGILSHGEIKWDEESNRYVITLGLRPFDARDGLGQFSFAFDLTGRILSKERFRYKW